MSNNIRIEEDLLGTREVPADAYYGVHTLRAIENFYISNNKISDIPEFVRGMVMVKKAAAMANKELQTIPKSVANAIIAACDEVLNNGKCMDQFPVDVYQGGAGTSVNMNTNEVLANIGLELMGHQKGEYQYLNPNDHVNKCQSTNDAYPTGFRIAVYSSLIKLVDAIKSDKYDVIIINFANPDMVGHTGVEAAAIKAVETVDACVGKAVEAIKEVDGQLFICADHGNAEQLVNYETGEPWTAHTTNPVPFILVNADPKYTLRENGCLADIVPTLIQLMGICLLYTSPSPRD